MKTIKALLLTSVLLLGGCIGTGSNVLDGVGNVMVDQAISYCGEQQYRRDALYILVNGALDARETGIEIAVLCPNDEVAE